MKKQTMHQLVVTGDEIIALARSKGQEIPSDAKVGFAYSMTQRQNVDGVTEVDGKTTTTPEIYGNAPR